jgi:hypothetical protein
MKLGLFEGTPAGFASEAAGAHSDPAFAGQSSKLTAAAPAGIKSKPAPGGI